MKIKMMKICSLVMGLAVLLQGCGTTDGVAGESGERGSVQMGRYMEERQAQQDFGRVGQLVKNNAGGLTLFSHNYGFYESGDEGKTWEKKEVPAVDRLLDQVYSMEAALGPEGEFAWIYQLPREEQEGTEEGNFQIEYRYFYMDKDGGEKELTLGEPQATDTSVIRFWFGPDGVLYASDFIGTLYTVDTDKSTLRKILEADSRIDLLAFTDSCLAAFTSLGVELYDYVNGEQLAQDKALNQFVTETLGEMLIYYTGGNYTLYAVGDKTDDLYMVSEEGIFRHTIGGGTVEKLMEGSLYTIGDPSVPVYGMVVSVDGEFLVHEGKSLSRFYFDASVPTLPDKTLRVYSLEKNNVMQQAVSLFQEKHSDVYVQYETGMSGEDSITQEDAVKQLNADILAGNGPDVLGIDGLPAASYFEKGMLSDLTPVLEEMAAKESYFENILYSYRGEKTTFAVPVTFSIPMIFGKSASIEKTGSPAELAQEVEALRLEKSQGTLLSTYEAENTLRLLALAYAPSWSDEQGTPHWNKIQEFLEASKRIYGAERAGLSEQDMEEYENIKEENILYGDPDSWYDAAWHSQRVYFDSDVLALGGIKGGTFGFDILLSAKKQMEGTDYGLFAGEGERVYHSQLTAGISSASGEQELAEEFLKLLLSSENLTKGGDDFSVNRDALEKSLVFPEGMTEDMDYGSMAQEDGAILYLYLPGQDDQERLYGILESLDTPYFTGGTLEETVVEYGKKVLSEEMDIDQAMEEIKGKTQLYLAE